MDVRISRNRGFIESLLHRRWAAFFCCLMLFLSVIAVAMSRRIPRLETESIVVDVVKTGGFVRGIRGFGVLTPSDFQWLTANSIATVENVLVKPGATIKKGDIILILNSPDLLTMESESLISYEQAKSDLLELDIRLSNRRLDLEASLAKAKSEYGVTKLKSDSEQSIAKDGIIPKIIADQSLVKLKGLEELVHIEKERLIQFEKTRRSIVSSRKEKVEHLSERLAFRRDQIRALVVTAESDGVVQSIEVEKGETVSRGENLAKISKVGDLIAEIKIPETQAKDLRINLSAKIDTLNDIVDGRVIRIDPTVVNGNVLVDVEVIGDLGSSARPDLSVEGTIEIEKLENILFLKRPFNSQQNQHKEMFVINKESSKAVLRSVIFGSSSNQLIEVVSGLSAGDRVIVSDMSKWTNHNEISIR